MKTFAFRPVFNSTGEFATMPDASNFPVGTVDFALCQICRVSVNETALTQPAAFLGWDNAPQENSIKIATLDQAGWFIDNLYRNNQQNCLYYMESFNTTDRQDLLTQANTEGNNDGGIIYNANTAENVTPENYKKR